ncbi:hypothetical protein E6C60_3119 [Paenibacillus algicola]|uniref:Uncharacterized protein n=1 Tax=Paenibacillus algicola TaxID=2565926 RepID=A0A4P8XPV9_9BACL|nr:hypothetical protein [Paenibacillus algicola]QCT03830.1 hypothetical protein E6C60_3119 [Paenibacillus algicola]
MSNPRKAKAVAQAAKAIHTELLKEFDKETAQQLLIASMPTITEDVVKTTPIRLYDGGIVDPNEMVVFGDNGPERIIPD